MQGLFQKQLQSGTLLILEMTYGYDAPERWQFFFQDAATRIMENITDLHHDIMFFLILISVLVSYLLISIIWSFQVANQATKRALQLQHNMYLEIFWTVVPALVLVTIALPSYVLLYNMDELLDPKVTLRIIGHQWYWTYEYSDWSKKTLNDDGIVFDSYMIPTDQLPENSFRLLEVDHRLVVPLHTSIRLLITSSDVIHSWAVPSLGVKLDAVPGRLNQIGVNLNRLGVFYGQCSEICGVNHSFMPIAVQSCPVPSFFNWASLQL